MLPRCVNDVDVDVDVDDVDVDVNEKVNDFDDVQLAVENLKWQISSNPHLQEVTGVSPVTGF